ncbi:hypothetical protein Tco_0257196 [Tanacetum coccineum]
MDKVQKPSSESTAQVPPPEEEDSIFIEIPKPKAKKTVNVEIQDLNSPRPNSCQTPRVYRDGLKDALVEMPKFNKWLSSLLRNKEKLEEIAITTVNAECSAIIMNKVPEKLEDPGKFSYPITWCLEAFEAHPNDHSSLLTVSLRTPIAMEVSSNFEEGYFDSEGDVIFLKNLLSDDTTHNLAPEVISDHEPEQNESSITFSPRSDPLHHEFAGEIITLPSRNDREFEEYLSLMTVLCEISTSRSQENVHANQSSIIESLPVSPIPVEDSDPVQEEIDIFLVPDDLIPPGVEK